MFLKRFKNGFNMGTKINKVLCKGAYIKYAGGGGRRDLQIFQKMFRSPGDHRPKYFMTH